MSGQVNVSFNDTDVAFRHKTNAQLKKARILFKSFNFPILLKVGPALSKLAVFLGLKGVIKYTIFEQFCGGENISESRKTIEQLAASNIGTILDYSVEGEESEQVFDATCEEILRTIDIASGDTRIPFSVFKTTGIIRFELLERVSSGVELNAVESAEWTVARARFEKICKYASKKNVRLFIDAEESWIQKAIDGLAEEMMARYNTNAAIVYNTLQMYRHDRLAYLEQQIAQTRHHLGFKIVRGAYMEKERERATVFGYEDPIQPDKASSDRDFNEALRICMAHAGRVSICAGTHNEESSMYLITLMKEAGMENHDERVYFSQLLGMSDHISYNLAHAGYKVAKYVPYGPVLSVIPYLTRRARENSSVAGQTGRELGLIRDELLRRRQVS